MKIRECIFWILIALLSFPLSAQDERSVAWLELEQGKIAFSQKDYGDAMVHFRQSLLLKPVYPEADYWIGRIYEVEGEYRLALAQYQKVLRSDIISALTVPGDEQEIRLHLAEVYKMLGEYDKYIEELVVLVSVEGYLSNAEKTKKVSDMIRTVKSDGLNKTFELYRLDDIKRIEIYSKLGEAYELKKDYENSYKYNLISFYGALSLLAKELSKKEPNFMFTTDSNFKEKQYENSDWMMLRENSVSTIDQFLKKVMIYPKEAAFAERVDLMKIMYQFAVSAEKNNQNSVSSDLLWLIVKNTKSSMWKQKALERFAQLNE